MKADILRDRFLDFFKSKKHKIAESDSLVPKDDPTVLFTPAGMNQFKKEFLGFDSGFKTVATAQRCLRTDDLDKVGKTRGHHTFFEMLGNFSFGGYFKKEAISFAWEFLIKQLSIDKEKLWVSVYKDDNEAYGIWREQIGIPLEKIVKLGDKENFWPSEAKQKGPNGPCGPCSEIFFDRGKDIGCKKADCNPSCNCGRFMEVWNLVFTQFNRKADGTLEPLPSKNIDTGMGLERLVAVMQGASNNFETDLFQPLIKEITVSSKLQNTNGSREFIYAIADHIRAITFAIYDGVLPSNETRGYVVRKLIRKSILHLRGLGIDSPFLYKLVPVLSQIMKKPYPELDKHREDIAQIIQAEEKSFILTLNSSDILFKDKFKDLLNKQDPKQVGRITFQLYDTYGIPLELTKDWLGKQGVEFCQDAFDEELTQQRNRSKLLSTMKGDVFDIKDLNLGIKETKFTGYKDYSIRVKILKIIRDEAEAKKINKGDEVGIILEKTVFYPESGGQVGDSGELIKGKNVFEVLDTKKLGKVTIHVGRVREGSFKKSDFVSARINLKRRLSIARNHTATHLLQAALREVLGPHVKQQGSLVAEDRLRFDFTHFKDVERRELSRIEEIVNNHILNNLDLKTKEAPLSMAKKTGALAFFGEKYENKVRIVSIGDFSKELCGGTHLEYTGQIGIFKIIQEESVASGVRRIEAVTGSFAYNRIKEQDDIITDISLQLNVPLIKIPEEINRKLSRIKELEKQANLQKIDSLKISVDMLVQNANKINEIKLITSIYSGLNMDLLRKTIDLIKQKTDKAIIALGSVNENKALLVIGVTEDLVNSGFDASKLVLAVSGVIGGSGGGRKDLAQAGGSKPENFENAFQQLRNIIGQ